NVYYLFFFQAEDGIRDRNVTGVQTCALPISAVLKEAHPDWDASQIINALKTSAKKLGDADPVDQGAGTIQIEEAINTDIIIDNPLLSFGKTGNKFNERALELTIENISNKDHTFRFNIPKRKDGITWKLPQSFEVKAGEK